MLEADLLGPDATKHAPVEWLRERVERQLAHAVAAARDSLPVYESLRNLNEVIGGEYGDRVVYELVQNAHDAHKPGDEGEIVIRLVLHSVSHGEL